MMCEANAYIIDEGGLEELFLENVDIIKSEDDGRLSLSSIIGEHKTINAKIKSISLVNHKVVLIPN